MSYLRKELLINISFLLIANALIKPYYIFFVERNIQNQAGTYDWGLYFTLFSLSMIPQILLDLGMTNHINKELSGDHSRYQSFWNIGLWSKPILAIVFVMVFLLLAWMMGYFHTHSKLVIWVATNQILASWILFCRAFLSGWGKYRWDSYLSIADKLLFILFFIFSVWIDKTPIDRFMALQTLALCIAGAGAILLVLRLQEMKIFQRPSISSILIVLKQSMPFALIFIIMVLFCRMEPVWIDLLRDDGKVQSGHYAAAYRIVDAGNMMGFLFAGLLLPMFSRSIAQKDSVELQSLFDFAWRLMIGLVVLLSIPIAFNHQSIMEVLYEHNYGPILDIAILCLVPLTINYLLSTFITASGSVNQLNKWFLWAILANAILHLLFTPAGGARGAAFAALITQCFATCLLILLIQRQGKIQIQMKHIRQCLILLLSGSLIGLSLNFIELHFVVKLMIHSGLLILLCFAFGYFPTHPIAKIVVSLWSKT